MLELSVAVNLKKTVNRFTSFSYFAFPVSVSVNLNNTVTDSWNTGIKQDT